MAAPDPFSGRRARAEHTLCPEIPDLPGGGGGVWGRHVEAGGLTVGVRT